MSRLAAKIDPAHAQLHLKVSLLYIRPTIWRRLLVPASIKLPKFHTVLQLGFGWTDSHLHAFRLGHVSYEPRYEDNWDDSSLPRHDESKFRLADLLHAKGDRLIYEYDFGDSWQHDVRVEKVLPVTHVLPAACTAGARAGPPEDCGSIPGYYNLLEALADPKHSEHHEILDWLGDPYDPDAFDVAATNSTLQRVKV